MELTMKQSTTTDLSGLDIQLERDGFMRELLRQLSGTLQDVVGVDEAAGFISIVGQNMGDSFNQEYCRALGVSSLDRHQVAAVMADLKQRIKGDFRVVSEDAEKIVLESHSCPFAEKVAGRPSLCMMTSNVFGTIAAENLGFARVHLARTIAQGDSGCRVEIFLNPDGAADAMPGIEYYKG
jgi:predicted ArsR family transcriptional regulator